MDERIEGNDTTDGSERRSRSVWKGLLAGLIAGVSATAVKAVAEGFYAPRMREEAGQTDSLAAQLPGVGLSRPAKEPARRAAHWGVGVAAGAAYGVAAEYFPSATHRDGASFGLALMALTHQTGLAETPGEPQHAARHEAGETAGHVLFGVVAERVRRVARKMLG